MIVLIIYVIGLAAIALATGMYLAYHDKNPHVDPPIGAVILVWLLWPLFLLSAIGAFLQGFFEAVIESWKQRP